MVARVCCLEMIVSLAVFAASRLAEFAAELVGVLAEATGLVAAVARGVVLLRVSDFALLAEDVFLVGSDLRRAVEFACNEADGMVLGVVGVVGLVRLAELVLLDLVKVCERLFWLGWVDLVEELVGTSTLTFAVAPGETDAVDLVLDWDFAALVLGLGLVRSARSASWLVGCLVGFCGAGTLDGFFDEVLVGVGLDLGVFCVKVASVAFMEDFADEVFVGDSAAVPA